MLLQSTTRLVTNDQQRAIERIGEAVDDLDVTIKEIRTAIFDLERRGRSGEAMRGQILDEVRSAAESLGFEPRVILDGPVDSAIDKAVAAELLATLREALSNVWRHAEATLVDVEVGVGREVTLRVADDGVGPPEAPTPTGKGLANMAARANRLGGSLRVDRRTPKGTLLEWRVPRG
jgi:signal transduction histidine kinase